MHLLADSQSAGLSAGGIILLIVVVAAYWTPAIVAWIRHVPNAGSVTVINFLLGWTLVGWAIALAMACRTRYVATLPYAGPAPVRFQPPPSPEPDPYRAPPPRPSVTDENTGLQRPYGYQ